MEKKLTFGLINGVVPYPLRINSLNFLKYALTKTLRSALLLPGDGSCPLKDAYPMNSNSDSPKWSWDKSGAFSIKSMYKQFYNVETNCPNKRIWKAKIPLKNKVFMWLIEQNVILTKDNAIGTGILDVFLP